MMKASFIVIDSEFERDDEILEFFRDLKKRSKKITITAFDPDTVNGLLDEVVNGD